MGKNRFGISGFVDLWRGSRRFLSGKDIFGVSVVNLISPVLIISIFWFLLKYLWFEVDWFTFVYVEFQVFIGVLVFQVMEKQKKWHTHTNTAASILTIIGIFGTFLGIFSGLLDFDVENIEEGIPDLLESLKLAFLTSIVGIGSAIGLKGIAFKKAVDSHEGDEDPISRLADELTKKLAKVETAGEEKLLKAFQEFSDNVAKGIAKLATDELIKALKCVVEDFNAKITEQFGENFKRLNEAVGKTVEWQEQYRQQMDELANEFRIAAESIEKSREAVASIAESSNTIAVRSERIVDCTEKLDPILHTLNDQLDAFSALRERALEAFPLIENRLKELTRGFSSAVQTAIDDSQGSVEAQREALAGQSELIQGVIEDSTEKFDRLSVRFSESVETAIGHAHRNMIKQQKALTERFGELESSTAAASKQFEKTIGDIESKMETQRKALDNYGTTLQTTIDGLVKRVNDTMAVVSSTANTYQDSIESQQQAVESLSQRLQSNSESLERTLEYSLRSSLRSLAGQLAALSEKFVEDYSPLTEKLQRLVNMAENDQRSDDSSF